LNLPGTLCQGLISAGFRCGFAGRVEQERGLYRTGIEIDERYEVSNDLLGAQTNLGESLAQSDDPEAAEVMLAAMTTARRIGDRSFENYCAGGLISTMLLTGEWPPIDALTEEIFGASDDEPTDAQFLHLRLVRLDVLRGAIS